MSLEQDMADMLSKTLERLKPDESIYVGSIVRNYPEVLTNLDKVYKLQKLYNKQYTRVEWISLNRLK